MPCAARLSTSESRADQSSFVCDEPAAPQPPVSQGRPCRAAGAPPSLPRAAESLPLDDWLSSLVTLSLAAPVGFSNFARAALAPSARTVQVPAPGADLWPCPPPTEWRWTGPRPSPRKRKLIAKRVLSSRLLQLIVCALNWQALGHPVQPPPAARLGALLSELQGAMLERLERFVMYFLSAPPVDLEALGRSADKFWDLFDRAGRLPLRCGAPVEPLLRDLVQDLNPYSRLRGPAESPTVRDEEPEAANALVASSAPPGAVQVASHGDQSPRSSLKPAADASCKPVRASRIKWPYSLQP